MGESIIRYFGIPASPQPVIIHRDINPKNVRLTPEDQIFLLDFGIAKRIDLKTFLVGGTPRFAPPEQLKDEGTDARSDIYALAATLYYLLTNVEPPDSLSREAALLKGFPDPLRAASEINKEIPSAVSRMLSRALSLERELRPHNAVTMRKWLTDAVDGVGFDEASTQSNEVDSETTQVTARKPVRVIMPFEVAMRGDITREATQLINLLDRRYPFPPRLIQVLIEVIDSHPEQRGEIISRHSELLRKEHDSKLQSVITLIHKLASDSYIEHGVRQQLRQKLGMALATHTLSEMSADDAKQSLIEPKDSTPLLDANTVRGHISHRKWLAGLMVWCIRGSLAATVAQLLLLPFIGGQTLITLLSTGYKDILWVVHGLLIGLSALLVLLIRRRKNSLQRSKEEPNFGWRIIGLCFGIFLAVIITHDILWMVGLI